MFSFISRLISPFRHAATLPATLPVHEKCGGFDVEVYYKSGRVPLVLRRADTEDWHFEIRARATGRNPAYPWEDHDNVFYVTRGKGQKPELENGTLILPAGSIPERLVIKREAPQQSLFQVNGLMPEHIAVCSLHFRTAAGQRSDFPVMGWVARDAGMSWNRPAGPDLF